MGGKPQDPSLEVSRKKTGSKGAYKKSSPSKSGYRKKKGTKGDFSYYELSSLKPEIICIILISTGLLLILSLFTQGGAGALGNFFSNILKGFFGFGAYVLPFAVIASSIIVLLSKQKYVSMQKIVMGILLFLIVISFVSVFNTVDETLPESAADYIKILYDEGGLTNGGLFGGIFGNFFLKVLGRAGTYILLLTSGTILLILVTGKSLFSFLMRVFASIDGKIAGIKGVYYSYGSDKNSKKRTSKNGSSTKPARKTFNYVLKDTDDEELPEEVSLITDNIKKARANKESENSFMTRVIKGSSEGRKTIVFPTSGISKDEHESYDSYDSEETGESEESEYEYDSFDVDSDSESRVEDLDSRASRHDIEVTGKGVIFDETSDLHSDLHSKDVIESFPKFKDSFKDSSAKHDESLHLPSRIGSYECPPISLLKENTYSSSLSSKSQILENSRTLEQTLKSFGVEVRVVEVSKGPAVTRYELSPGHGVKVSKISLLADDLALSLAAVGIRIEAPIPGKSVVGIEIPNKEVQSVFLREVIDNEEFLKHPSKLAFAVGKDIAGNAVVADIAKMPHLLIAGSTGSGKSVCINTIITSILYKASPYEVKFLMIDPKVVELSIYNGIPHLLIPVVTDPKKASSALNWAVQEMDARYSLFAETATRDLSSYNATLTEQGELPIPQIVIVIDELADLMMTAKSDVENAICRIAQKARAAGIHLVIATQRPSVDVITGLIKTNVPSRLAFAVASGIDSRTILDSTGAEKLIGKGDMLFSPTGISKPQRIQGAFISDKEVESVVNFIKCESEAEYDPLMVEKITSAGKEDDLELFEEALEFVAEKGKISVTMLQRRFRIGYNRAARLMDMLETRGVIGPEDGSKPRNVLITQLELEEFIKKGSGK